MKKRLILSSVAAVIFLISLVSVLSEDPAIPDSFSIGGDSSAAAPSAASTAIDTVTIDLEGGKSTKIKKIDWSQYFEVEKSKWKLKDGAYDSKTDTWTTKTTNNWDGVQIKYSSDGQSMIRLYNKMVLYFEVSPDKNQWEKIAINQAPTKDFAQANVKNVNGKTVVEYADGSASVNAQVIPPVIVKQAGGTAGIDFSKDVSASSLSTNGGGKIIWEEKSGMTLISQTTPTAEGKPETTDTTITLPNGQKLESTEKAESIIDLEDKTIKLGDKEYTVSEVTEGAIKLAGKKGTPSEEETVSINSAEDKLIVTENKGTTTTTSQYQLSDGHVTSQKTKVEEDGKAESETIINFEIGKNGKQIIKETGASVFEDGEKQYTKYTNAQTGAVSYGFEPEGEVKKGLEKTKEATKQNAKDAKAALAEQAPKTPTLAQYQTIEQSLSEKKAEVIKKEDEVQKKGEELILAEAALTQAESAVDKTDASVNQAKENLKKAKAAEEKAGAELAVLGSEIESLQQTFDTADTEKKKQEELKQKLEAASQKAQQAEAAATEARIYVSDDGENICVGTCFGNNGKPIEANFVSPEGLNIQNCKIGTNLCTQEQVDVFKEKAKIAAEARKSELSWMGVAGWGKVLSTTEKVLGSIKSYRGFSDLIGIPDSARPMNWLGLSDQAFASIMLERYFASAICDTPQDVAPKGTAYIETSSESYQAVAHIEMERSLQEIYVLCDETRPCTEEGYSCSDEGFCQKGKETLKAYFYKITWGVTAPSDEAFTTNIDEGGNAVSFNIKVGDNWLYEKDGISKKNTIKLKKGGHDEGAMVYYSLNPSISEACIIWDAAPKTLSTDFGGGVDEIGDVCNDVEVSTAGSINYEASGGEGSSSSTVSSGEVTPVTGFLK